MRFYLKTPNANESVIWCQLQRARVSTGIKVPTKYWDRERQQASRSYPLYKEVNEKLRNFTPPQDDLILPFFYEWATKGTSTKIHPRRGDFYSYNIFAGFCNPQTTFAQIDYKFYDDFLSYLQDKGLSANSQGGHISKLKAVMNEAYKRGMHGNIAYRSFKKPVEVADTVYLTEEELERIRGLELTGRIAKVRDLFLIGCNTAMRFSDYSRMTDKWFVGDEIHFISTKTSTRQVIPLTDEVRSIVKKYNGFAPYVNHPAFNRMIKDVCREADINEEVQTERTVGKEKVVQALPKYELVSSHTARRTAATLLVKRGAPIAWVMSLTGHKTEDAFWKYIKLSREDYAKLLKKFML